MLVYFMCTFGAILSDVYWGKFKTILILSIVYAIGSIIVTMGAIPIVDFPADISLYIGLLLIAIGSGGIKPCVAAFGGDYFKMPEQTAQMATYFSLYYLSVNSVSLLSIFVSPALRADIHCFGDDDCYPLAFGLPVILMISSIGILIRFMNRDLIFKIASCLNFTVIFVVGKPLYTMVENTSGNMMVEVGKCITTGINEKRRRKATEQREHFLDYAIERCGQKLVNETKILLKILVLYLPLPLFWALFDQQGSRWTLQAARMDGDLGFYDIKPDQMQVFNPLLILAFIPMYDAFLYPLLAKVGIRRPLQKLTAGGFLAGVAFILSALVEFKLEETYPVLPKAGEAQFRIYNGYPCDYHATTLSREDGGFNINSLDLYELKHLEIDEKEYKTFDFHYKGTDDRCPSFIKKMIEFEEEVSRLLFLVDGETNFSNNTLEDNPGKSSTGKPKVRFLLAPDGDELQIEMKKNGDLVHEELSTSKHQTEVPSGQYEILVANKTAGYLELKQGGVYTVLIRMRDDGDYDFKTFVIAIPNSVSMLWLVPQYVVMTLGEVMFSITGLAFSYAQAPESMKSVLQACWLLAVAFGNVIDMIIVKLKLFDSQTFEFLLFSSLMFVDMVLFMFLAQRYKGQKESKLSETLPLDTKDEEHRE